jgi:putative ABC transport system substrate-binding protein
MCGAAAQAPPGKVYRIGFLDSTTPADSSRRIKVFQDEFRRLGYTEGTNLITEYRYARGRLDNLRELADELVHLKVDVLITNSSNITQAAKEASKTIPIVFTSVIDPVKDGFVASLAKPGGNLTGFTILAPDLNGKRLELLKEAFPKITRVGFLLIGGSPRGEQRFSELEAAAKGLELRLLPFKHYESEDLESAFHAAKKGGAQALIWSPTTFLNVNLIRIIDLAAKSRLPAIYPSEAHAEAGGLMSYGPDFLYRFRRAAIYVDKILKGAKPAELPVEQPTRFEFVINLKTANQIGLTIPPNVLARADRVIR